VTGLDAGALALAAQTAEQAATDALWMRGAVLALCLITLGLILWGVSRPGEAQRDPHARWILLIAFLVLSPLAYVLSFGLAIDGSKPVEFCDSCHVMNPYVVDLKNPDSELLAAQHYQFRWIADHQCYTCHSDYGLFGDAGAKLAGMRHFWHYYVAGWEEPIKVRGTYDNQRCLFCHGPVVAYREVTEHKDHADAIARSEKSCIGGSCHVSPHPKHKEPVKEARRD
jgi:hypothetical protein